MVKLELINYETDELVSSIDLNISEFISNKIKIYDQNQEIQDSLDDLYRSWIQLKEIRTAYIQNPSSEIQKEFIEKSEEVWDKSNNTVFISQLVSEQKLERYKISFVFFLCNLALGMILIFSIKRYVKDNLEYLVNYDGLTNIYNRRYFKEYLINEIQRAERYRKKLSLIMFDVDHFKKVNDTYGHNVGDSVLKELSNLIQVNIRKCDILSRLGGEEFGILAPEISTEDAFLLSEKLRIIVASHGFKYIDKLTISLGVTQFIPGDTVDSIYQRADTALYLAKNQGRNRSEIM